MLLEMSVALEGLVAYGAAATKSLIYCAQNALRFYSRKIPYAGVDEVVPLEFVPRDEGFAALVALVWPGIGVSSRIKYKTVDKGSHLKTPTLTFRAWYGGQWC